MTKLHPGDSLIFRVAIPIPIYRLFDYLAPDNVDLDNVKPGLRVEVPFGKGKKIAFLLEIVGHSEIETGKLKQVLRILDHKSLLSGKDLRLLTWASHYYHHPMGEVISTAFPAALRQGKSVVLKTEKHYALTDLGKATVSDELLRTPKQKSVLEKFQSSAVSLSEAELSLWNDNWRSAVKQLISRQLLQFELGDAKVSRPEVLIKNTALLCNPPQQAAIDAVCNSLGQFGVFLLEGVTGSGKTEVYLQIIHKVLERGQQILVLVPEITLTPQLEERFRQRFAVNIALSHSKLTDIQRQTAWLQMQNGECSILLGTRSALFTPLKNPGLIILDEEHDGSFKQQEGFRFSARDIAIVRGKMLHLPVLLGSATPSLESLHNVDKQRYQLLHLPDRAGNAIEPVLQLMDIRNKRIREGLSEALVEEMRRTLAKKEQVLLFLNRRGFAPTLICHGCGWVARCQRCDANLVIHFDEECLRCHHCGKEQRLIKQCPACKVGELTPLGLGTERVEKVLAELFKDKVTVRLDRDSTQRKGSLENYLQQINQGKVDIILGTQMLAKGHHFPNVTLVAILDVDSGLFSIDFHAPEKLAQMIVQVSGRAGRAEKPGKVIMQTRQPEHPLLITLIRQGYRSFAKTALAERKEALLPPFSYQALLRVQAGNEDAPLLFFEAVSVLVQKCNPGHTQVLGPVPAPMARRAGLYRYQLLLQNSRRKELHVLLALLIPEIAKLKQAKKVRWSLDVDPVDLY
ncbi:primosomal protein N' [Methylobacter psychrophilus]|uniref:primosomal protein N' n=1 Tax=Methylobacter psychrophilus TaxID=96941 RepID=UPI0021D487CA|nr:primosomal protein N' [Methylobacter psychrophilus]